MRILVADDSKAAAARLATALVELGHEVVGRAANGNAAVEMYESLRPDVVILDIVMPEMDGLSALRLIRTMDGQAKAIVVSSAGGVGSRVAEGLRLGAVAVLSKPFSNDDLRLALEGCAGGE